ncbi:MAG: DUF1592 domain-containing protein [Bryobacteraceae bacterium]
MRFIPLLFAAAAFAGELPPDARTFLNTHCTGCHRGSAAPAALDLSTLPFRLDDPHIFTRWVRVHDAVRDGAMPPKIAAAGREAFVEALAKPIAAHERDRAAAQGRSVLRRLNRYEYENTVRDLLAAPWLQLRDSLPEDGIVGRFNKVGQALDVSHVQMARYMETAEQAIRRVLDAANQPEVNKRYYAREQKRFLNRMRYSSFNRHPERATIPVLGVEAQPDVLHEKVPITVGESDPKTRDLEAFATPAGNYVGNEHHFDQFVAPSGGRYRLRFNAYSIWIHSLYGPEGRKDRPAWWRPNRELTSQGRTNEPVTIYALSRGGEKRLLGSFDVNADPATHDLDVYLLPGEMILPDAARLFRSRPGFVGSPDATKEGMPGVAYRWMEVTGPVANAASRLGVRRMFSGIDPAQPNSSNPKRDAEKLLRQFMARAYRRPPTEPEVQRYLKIIRERDANFTEAMIAGYVAVLCSPGFLYLEEQPGKLSGHALASRLSYFLWNGPPDRRLRTLAEQGALSNPEVLRTQTDRLLDDDRSRTFIDAFLDYWLDLRKLNETTPDQTLYPDYYLDDLLTESALLETQLFVHYLIRKNLPASTLIDSNFTMLNSHLARHYGLLPVDGVALRQVTLPPDSVRGGLLTQASVLKVTANGTTTSPVLRGVWILERLLGDPPPPPPPGVQAVEPDTRGATTIRQQLDKHRADASCAGCHAKIDPPGFALENFDVLGGWRERYRSTENGAPVKGLGKNGHAFTFKDGQPVDAAGQLANGASFKNIAELKKLLLKDERQIARNAASQLITYGTGAPVSFGDRAALESILNAAEKDRYGLRTIIHEIVQSELFTHK